MTDYVEGLEQIEREGYQQTVKKARNALFITAGLVALGELINSTGLFKIADTPVIIVTLAIIAVEVGVFLGLAFFTKKKPYTAVLWGLIAFIALWVLAMVNGYAAGGASGLAKGLFGGIIIKGFVLYTLIRALGDARALQDSMERDKL